MIRFVLCSAALMTLGFTGPQAEAQPRPREPSPTEVVKSWYRHFMGREPDAQGLQDHVWHIQNGTSYRDVLANFLGSDEYYVRKGSTPEGFITGLYRDVLRRSPSSAELQTQLDGLYRVQTRNEFARNFLIASDYEKANRVITTPARVAPPPPPPEEGRYLPPSRRLP